MTTLAKRSNTALLIVDMQTGVVAAAHGRGAVIANIARLVEKARAAGVPIVWVQHNDRNILRGGEAWAIVPELDPHASEALVEKSYADAFEETTLESVLAGHGAGRLFIAGAQTDECIRATLHGAIVRGYDAILVADAHTAEDLTQWGAPPPEQVIAHTNLYWSNHRAPGRTAGTVKTQDLTFGA
jgi:nicotinamidase-related amidase